MQTFPIKYQDHLLYHYLGGTILALQGDYVRACDLLEIVSRTSPISSFTTTTLTKTIDTNEIQSTEIQCVSAPGPAVSMIQLDAHKKLVLIQLLAYGKVRLLPFPYTSIWPVTHPWLVTDPPTSKVYDFGRPERLQVVVDALQRIRHCVRFSRQDEIGCCS